MKRDFLKDLGIPEDKIDQIMAENGKDIESTKAKYADYDDIIRSIMEKLSLLPGATDIYPGHGWSSTIGREMRTNPFLEPFNEPAEDLDPDLPGVELHSL